MGMTWPASEERAFHFASAEEVRADPNVGKHLVADDVFVVGVRDVGVEGVTVYPMDRSAAELLYKQLGAALGVGGRLVGGAG